MDSKIEKRIGIPELRERVVSAEEAAALIPDGSVVGMSGFTRAGDAKVVPLALAERAKKEPFKIDVYQKMCCNGLAILFADDRRRNTALPAFGCAWEKARVRLIEVESNGTD